jgi:rRNA processing protein Gar1
LERDRIKKLGTIKFFSDLGNAIVYDPPKLPKIGSNVVTERMDHIGQIVDIFGPVKSPYVSIRIKPQYKETVTIETMLYVIDRKPANVRQRKKPSSHKYSRTAKK